MSQISTDLTNAPPEVLALLANTPAIPPPHGTAPNFVDPVDKSDIQIGVTAALLSIVMMFAMNRAYVKLFRMKKITWDDVTLLLALLSSIAYWLACTLGAKNGIGKHSWDIRILDAAKPQLLIPCYLISVLAPLTFLFLKSTFFILYLQLFKQFTVLRYCSWVGLVGTVVTYTVLSACVFAFATPPPGRAWLAHQTSQGTKNVSAMAVPLSSVGLAIDVYILIIPIVEVSSLSMSPKKKIGVLLIFLSGTMACVCSACSIYFRILLNNTPDSTWALVPVNISTVYEMFVGIICACMPAAAYATRQRDSLFNKLLQSAMSLRSKWSSSRKSCESSSESTSEMTANHPEPEMMKSTDRKYAQYFNLTDSATSLSTKLAISDTNTK